MRRFETILKSRNKLHFPSWPKKPLIYHFYKGFTSIEGKRIWICFGQRPLTNTFKQLDSKIFIKQILTKPTDVCQLINDSYELLNLLIQLYKEIYEIIFQFQLCLSRERRYKVIQVIINKVPKKMLENNFAFFYEIQATAAKDYYIIWVNGRFTFAENVIIFNLETTVFKYLEKRLRARQPRI